MAFAATVGTALRLLQDISGKFGKIIVGLIGIISGDERSQNYFYQRCLSQYQCGGYCVT
jgi:hypothetical protein